MFDIPNKDIIPYFKKGGKVQIINKSVIKKKKMKQKQTQKQIVNIYNTKPTQRKRVYKKTDDKKDVQQPQRMPVYYTQPQYNQYLPAPTITMPTKLPQAFERSSVLPTMTADTKLPTLTGLTTGLKTTQETGTSPETELKLTREIETNTEPENETEKMRQKQKELVDFFFRNASYKDGPLPNYNYGRERLPPLNPINPPQADYKDPDPPAISENDDKEYIKPPEEEPPSLVSDVPANNRYSNWTYEQLKLENINRGLYVNTTQPLQGQKKYDELGNIVKKGSQGYDQARRPKTKNELKDALYQYDQKKN